jgi:Spy/CpxP family protein refolding chaperone
MNRPTLRFTLLAGAAFMLVPLPALAQISVPQPAPPVRAPTSANHAPHQQPCWQQVGISKAAIDQRHSIEQSTRAQVEAVCADSSLTVQQKHAKIKEIRQQAHQEIESVITPQQQQELKACNAERAAAHPSPAPAPHPGAPAGPCGELATNSAPAPGRNSPGTPSPGASSTPEQQ